MGELTDASGPIARPKRRRRTLRKFAEPRGLTALLSVLLLLGVACGRSAEEEPTPTAAPGVELATTTTPGTQPVDSITWGVYRETNSLDPIYAFDYPENTVLAVLCETLLRQAPDGSIVPEPFSSAMRRMPRAGPKNSRISGI